MEKPEQPRLVDRFVAAGALTDASDVVIASTNASLFAYVGDGTGGLKVLQLTSPASQPNFYGFSPAPRPELIASRPARLPAVLPRGPAVGPPTATRTGLQTVTREPRAAPTMGA